MGKGKLALTIYYEWSRPIKPFSEISMALKPAFQDHSTAFERFVEYNLKPIATKDFAAYLNERVWTWTGASIWTSITGRPPYRRTPTHPLLVGEDQFLSRIRVVAPPADDDAGKLLRMSQVARRPLVSSSISPRE